MDDQQIRTIIESLGETGPLKEDSLKKVEYMMDFGSVAVLVNMSLN